MEKLKNRQFTRRRLLRGSLLAGLSVTTAAALAGCGETQIVTERVVEVVTKEVPVEKIVTRIVEKEKIVEVEKVVTKEVEKIIVQEKVVEKIVAPATPKPITGEVVFWDWFSPTANEALKRWFAWVPAALKEVHPNLKLKIEHVPFGDMVQKILAASAAGNPPDVLHTSVDWGLALYLRDQLHELTPFVKKSPGMSLDNFVPVAETFSTFRGQQYALPWDSPDSRLYWYNRAMFEEAGVEPSWETVSTWKWDGFSEAMMKLTKKDAGGKVTRSGYLVGIPNQEILAALMHSQGVGFFNADFTKLELSANDACAKSVQLYLDLLKSVSAPLTAERQDRQIFYQGGAAAVTGGNWWVPDLREQAPDLDADMAPYPNGGKAAAATTWLNNLTFPKNAKNSENGWSFAEFYSSIDTYRSYLNIYRGQGPRKAIVDTPEYAAAVAAEPLFSRVNDITALGGYDPSFMLWSELDPIFTPRMQKIFVQGADIMTELKAIDDEFNPILEKFFKGG